MIEQSGKLVYTQKLFLDPMATVPAPVERPIIHYPVAASVQPVPIQEAQSVDPGTITTFTHENVRQVVAAVEEALKVVADKYELEFEKRGSRFSREELTPNVSFKTKVTADGLDAQQARFVRECRFYGMGPGGYKALFTQGGETFEVWGFEPKRPKYSVRCRYVRTGKGRALCG